MAIGCVHTEWMFRLQAGRHFAPGSSLIDLGPQDIQVPRPYLESRAFGELGPGGQAGVAAIYDGNDARRDGQAPYYRLFGVAAYSSADLDDTRATYKVDLNRVPQGLPQFDIVTDFGTAEHVYDIARVFETMHALLKPGGLALHVVPAFAFPNHGFYTPNPNLFIEFARANEYRLIDFSYVDNMFVRERLQATRPPQGIDFDALPIRLQDMENTQVFMTKVVRQFHANLTAADTREVLEALSPADRDAAPYPADRHHLCFVFDLMFIALRKPEIEAAIRPPIQRMEGVAPLPSALRAAMPQAAAPAPGASPRPLWRRAIGRAARTLGLR
ncbi:MAG: class I SAM-dependent methyltransferase [Alphaproteobacteria bacterium]|nr:class I SAM-dependent methyltransferase [Alphaproteobacteria bacterium]